jgi:glycosyltransferase involved in cell wall biosynthesis
MAAGRRTDNTPQRSGEIASERCTIIVTPRDLFSTTEECLESIFKNTPEPFDLIVVMGGPPDSLKRRLQLRYEDRARLIFRPDFLNGAQLRNIGLREAKTRLAVCLDTNIFVRPGWLSPLIQCQIETSAAEVVPLCVDQYDNIHTAGNDLFITYQNGEAIGKMELRCVGKKLHERTNLTRSELDFGEVHCQLFVVDIALKLGVYDERLREGIEMDSGLTLRHHRQKIMVEPSSIVCVHYPPMLKHKIDVALYRWQWNIPHVMGCYEYLKTKWHIDLGTRGDFKAYLVKVNARVGVLTQIWPSDISLFCDRALVYAWVRASRPFKTLRWTVRAWRTGYYKAHS